MYILPDARIYVFSISDRRIKVYIYNATVFLLRLAADFHFSIVFDEL